MDDLHQVVANIVQGLGRIDILVNNAGTIRRTPAVDFSETDWDDVLQINLKAAFFLSQAVGHVMMQQDGGKIINVASMLSWRHHCPVVHCREERFGRRDACAC